MDFPSFSFIIEHPVQAQDWILKGYFSVFLAVVWGKQSFLSKHVAILAACSSGFLFTELCFPAEIATYPNPKFQV
jgi:hypothetical protein